MKKRITKYWKNLSQELRVHYRIYIALLIILCGALFVRVYRIDQLLGFYFDQGRDAKVIRDLWHNGKPFLIGPTTGIEGIFRGPWYYWLIAPFYLLGNGDPVWPSVFLSFTTVVALFILYLLGKEVAGRTTGLLAAFIGAFSYALILASRWLSNPTPMLLISMLLIWVMFKVMDGKKWAWIMIGFLLGQAMQFGSAAEVFYFPVVAVFALWQRKNLPDAGSFFLSALALLLAFMPQIIFDLRHDGILRQTMFRFIFDEKSFVLSFWEVLQLRLPFYLDVFMSKLFLNFPNYRLLTIIFTLVFFFVSFREILSNNKFKAAILVLAAPLVGMLFFQGNEGNVYDYYFTGYYLVFVLIFAVIWGTAAKHYILARIIIILFALIFFTFNASYWKPYLQSTVDGPDTIMLGNQKQILEWIYKDAGETTFNVDVYVPPVIPHAYDYLFLWWGTTRYNKKPVVDQQVSLLYTVYEQDGIHGKLMEKWVVRQDGIGKLEREVHFGGITAQRRNRLENKQ